MTPLEYEFRVDVEARSVNLLPKWVPVLATQIFRGTSTILCIERGSGRIKNERMLLEVTASFIMYVIVFEVILK